MATVVVGVDGSDGAQEALRFAAAEARLRGAVVRAVMAWEVDTMAYSGGAWGPMIDPTGVEQSTRALLDTAVDKVQADGAGDVRIERVVATGRAAQVLIEQARDADLLVVGSRGHGGFTGLLLGSVGQQCALHAPCPVTIVRGRDPYRVGARAVRGSGPAGYTPGPEGRGPDRRSSRDLRPWRGAVPGSDGRGAGGWRELPAAAGRVAGERSSSSGAQRPDHLRHRPEVMTELGSDGRGLRDPGGSRVLEPAVQRPGGWRPMALLSRCGSADRGNTPTASASKLRP